MASKQAKQFLSRRARDLMNRAHEISGRSIRNVARQCYLDHGYVARILRGERRPRRDTMLLLCIQGWNLDTDMTNNILSAEGYEETVVKWRADGQQ
jgi:transcriptional regulator with XRE-family HTH domain